MAWRQTLGAITGARSEFAVSVFGFFREFEVFLGGVEGFVPEPGLDGANAGAGAEPAG